MTHKKGTSSNKGMPFLIYRAYSSNNWSKEENNIEEINTENGRGTACCRRQRGRAVHTA